MQTYTFSPVLDTTNVLGQSTNLTQLTDSEQSDSKQSKPNLQQLNAYIEQIFKSSKLISDADFDNFMLNIMEIIKLSRSYIRKIKRHQILKYYESKIAPERIDWKNLDFDSMEQIDGHIRNIGHASGQEKNRLYINNDITYMKCNDHYTAIDTNLINYIKNHLGSDTTWYYHQVGYICAKYKNNTSEFFKYLHRHIIESEHSSTDPKLSIDHINQDKLDNRLCNLRWTTQSVQNENRDKVARHKNAQPLPEDEEIPANLPKYVTYNTEIYDKKNNSSREFFRIEHPRYTMWSSSKSAKIPIKEKYNQTLKTLNKMNMGTSIAESKYEYAIGIRYDNKKASFVFDYRNKLSDNSKSTNESINKSTNESINKSTNESTKSMNLRKHCEETQNNYKLFCEEIKEKYPNFVLKNRNDK